MNCVVVICFFLFIRAGSCLHNSTRSTERVSKVLIQLFQFILVYKCLQSSSRVRKMIRILESRKCFQLLESRIPLRNESGNHFRIHKGRIRNPATGSQNLQCGIEKLILSWITLLGWMKSSSLVQSSSFLKPVTSNIRLKIRLSYFHTLLIEDTVRIS